MKKNKSFRFNFNDKYVKKFIFTYSSLLIVPIVFFSLIYLLYFQGILRSKLLGQEEKQLKIVSVKIDTQIRELDSFGLQSSMLSITKSTSLKNEANNESIHSLLMSSISTSSFIDEIIYMNDALPNRIFTNLGSFTPDYFPILFSGQDSRMSLLEFLKMQPSVNWLISQNGGRLYFLTGYKIYNTHYWMFRIKLNELDAFFQNDVGVIRFYYQNQLLYTIDHSDSVSMDETETLSVPLSGGLVIEKVIPKSVLYTELVSTQFFFLFILILLLILGGGLVVFFTASMKKPLDEMKDLCYDLVEVPEYMECTETVRFTLNQLQSNMNRYRQKQKQDELLYQLIYHSGSIDGNLPEKMSENGLFREKGFYRVILLHAETLQNMHDLQRVIEMSLPDEIEQHTLTFENQKLTILVLGSSESYPDNVVVEKFRSFAEWLNPKREAQELCIYAGKEYRDLKGISRSYAQAVLMRNKIRNASDGPVFIFSEQKSDEREYLYPHTELSALYESLINADLEKSEVITDYLLKILEDHASDVRNTWVLGYDIIHTYYRAREELQLQDKVLDTKLEDGVKQGKLNPSEIIELVKLIQNQNRSRMIQGDMPIVEEADRSQDFVARVIAFVDENSRNSELCVKMVANHFNVSISNLSHQFKAVTDYTISAYISNKKILYAKWLLVETDYTIQTIAELIGYQHPASFIRMFKQTTEYLPTEYREQFQEQKHTDPD